MSETPESPTVRTATATEPPPAPLEAAPYHRTPRVFQFAAWVAIVAGIVFIVAVIFFTGFMLGRHAGHHGGFHHKHHAAFMHPHRMGGPGGPGGGPVGPGGPGGGPVGPGGPGGPGATTPGGGPTTVRPSAGVGQLPPSVFHSAATSSGAAADMPTVIVLTG